MARPWILARCKEVEKNPDGNIDLWSREHYKSTILTFGKTIQDLLVDPNRTFGLFSYSRPLAKGFLRQIKREFEANPYLRRVFPDIIWNNPERDSPKWSEDEGIVLRRSANHKEGSIEAWGLVDGQPVGRHFYGLVYDDVVTAASVTSPDMMAKTMEAMELSYSLGTDGGIRRCIGTRYHFNDAYRTLIERQTFKPRIRLATSDGTMTGEMAIWSREKLEEKRRDMGPYTFACFVAGTPVLMGDWSQKNLEDVQIGEEVIGYTFGAGQRAKLVRTKVVAVNSRPAEVVRFDFASGRSLVGTRDHKFWQGRASRGYAELGFTHGKLKAACSVYDPRTVFTTAPERSSGYLAGLIDGEGSLSAGTVHISQSMARNPEVCERIESALQDCGIPYSVTAPRSRLDHRDYFVTGGRQSLMRLLNCIGDAAKAQRIRDAMIARGRRNFGKGMRDDLIGITETGVSTVYNIQTETGNYVANGFAVKNCQILQNPAADGVMGFKREWLKFYEEDPQDLREGMNCYLLVDAASEKKKQSDYTAMWVIGLNNDHNAYVIDIVRDRLNLTERARKTIALHRKWRPLQVRYEQYGMQADIEHIRYLQREQNYRFSVEEVGGQTPKNDRIRRLLPWFEQGRLYFPKTLWYTDYEGQRKDLIQTFLDDEYCAFPVSVHDDMLDALARLLEPDLSLLWPRGELPEKKEDRYRKRWLEQQSANASSWAA